MDALNPTTDDYIVSVHELARALVRQGFGAARGRNHYGSHTDIHFGILHTYESDKQAFALRNAMGDVSPPVLELGRLHLGASPAELKVLWDK